MAAAHVDVMTQADHAEILQETEQKTEQEEAVKDQQEQEATSGDTGGKYTKPAVVMEDGGTISKISLSEAAKGDREL